MAETFPLPFARTTDPFYLASRHSRRIFWLRRLFLSLGLIGLVGLGGFGAYTWLRKGPKTLSMASTHFDRFGLKIEQPQMAGLRKDGRPYEVWAQSAVQSYSEPDQLMLQDLRAKILHNDHLSVQVSAPHGIYDAPKSVLYLPAQVSIETNGGHKAILQNAEIHFSLGTIKTQESVQIFLEQAEIKADRMHLSEPERHALFEGNVKTIFFQALLPLSGPETD